MNSSGQLSASDSAVRPLRTGKRRGRPRKTSTTSAPVQPATEMAAVGTLTRTKSLLLAALRVWELKQRGLG
ncbi:hypothetical protein BH18VER1_BH18VER1_11630 [soil metagenome]